MSRRRKPNRGNPARNANCVTCSICGVCRPLVGGMSIELDENFVPTGVIDPVCSFCASKVGNGVLP